MTTEPIVAPDLNALWRDVVACIPSRHIKGDLATQLVGFRAHLALDAHQRVASGGWVRYLEVGVRMGHSLAIVALAAAPRLEAAVGVDSWVHGYAGEANDGPGAVYKALGQLRIDHDPISLLTGSSHDVLPVLADSGELFNLVLIDGDHTGPGAAEDLDIGFELLEPGGLLVFDDLVYRGDHALESVWRWFIEEHGSRFTSDGDGWGSSYASEPAWAWCRKGGA